MSKMTQLSNAMSGFFKSYGMTHTGKHVWMHKTGYGGGIIEFDKSTYGPFFFVYVGLSISALENEESIQKKKTSNSIFYRELLQFGNFPKEEFSKFYQEVTWMNFTDENELKVKIENIQEYIIQSKVFDFFAQLETNAQLKTFLLEKKYNEMLSYHLVTENEILTYAKQLL